MITLTDDDREEMFFEYYSSTEFDRIERLLYMEFCVLILFKTYRVYLLLPASQTIFLLGFYTKGTENVKKKFLKTMTIHNSHLYTSISQYYCRGFLEIAKSINSKYKVLF